MPILAAVSSSSHVARLDQGKRGGFRTIVAYRRGGWAVFLFGFAKSERENLDDDELAQWQRIVGPLDELESE